MRKEEDYLQATRLCDFDRGQSIAKAAHRLTEGYSDQRQRFDQIRQFVKQLPYGLEDWDVKASESLRKGWGMCCGKTNLLVAMSRILLIPARYRIFKIRSERRLLEQVMQQNRELAGQLRGLPAEQDHVQCEVYLDGWELYDPSRDSAFGNGLKRLGIPLERVPAVAVDGAVRVLVLSSIDEWAGERQRNRMFRKDRESLFARVNEQIDRIRDSGRQL